MAIRAPGGANNIVSKQSSTGFGEGKYKLSKVEQNV